MVGVIRSEVIFATCIIYMWSPSCLRFPQHSHHGSKIVYPWTWTPWMVLGGKSHVVVSHSHQLYTTLRGREIIEISEVTKWQSVHKKCIKIQSPPRPLVCLPTAPIWSTLTRSACAIVHPHWSPRWSAFWPENMGWFDVWKWGVVPNIWYLIISWCLVKSFQREIWNIV